jgi:hypothetical protein
MELQLVQLHLKEHSCMMESHMYMMGLGPHMEHTELQQVQLRLMVRSCILELARHNCILELAKHSCRLEQHRMELEQHSLIILIHIIHF